MLQIIILINMSQCHLLGQPLNWFITETVVDILHIANSMLWWFLGKNKNHAK